MPFRQQLGQLFNDAKAQVDKFQTERHGAGQSQAGPPGQQPINPSPNVYWQANFDPATQVSSTFKHQTGDWGWGNEELQNYTPNPQNSFYTSDHKLILRAIANSAGPDHGKYTSARLTSLQTTGRQRGCIQAVLTPPCARGVWPAFWLLPNEPFQWPNEGEVDIMETWNADLINHSCLHWGQFNAADAQKHRVIETNIPDFASPQGHTFAFAWNQPDNGQGGQMVWYIDGRPVMKASIPAGTRPMNDWQIIINVAMGGKVNEGVVPADGTYDFVVHSIQMLDEPVGGWGQFDNTWNTAVEGHF